MGKLLESINFPKDLKQLDKSKLEELCTEIREYMIECCSVNPGHLGSSLGAVELIVALHYIYNAPFDKLVFDVGHQAYAHKILTGRREAFKKLRTKEGISGFPKISESEYDAFGVGHASTSISAALGYAEAARLQKTGSKTVALIGDGAMSGGLAFEGMNNIGELGSDILIIINDNNQSIDGNIGALHKHLLNITTDPAYNKIKTKIWHKLGEGKVRKALQHVTTMTKSSLVSNSGGHLFEALGFRYFGPVDGNDINSLVDILTRLNEIKGPRILHVITKKGKGYAPAEDNPTIWHAPGKFNAETGERPSVAPSLPSKYQDVFGNVLTELAGEDKKIVGITPAMSTGCGMTVFENTYPDRFYDVGIEEEHAVTFAAGLAAGGLKPFCNIYSTFSQRAYDQIIHDVALQKLPVVLCFDRGGLVGEDGATHNGCFDMAAYRSIPGAVISSPMNEIELKNLMYEASFIEHGPYIIRYPRGRGEGVDWKNSEFTRVSIGRGEQVFDWTSHLVSSELPSNDARKKTISILGIGPCVNHAVEAVKDIADITTKVNVEIKVFNMRFLKPIDTKILDEAMQSDVIITVEDGCLKGGLYGAVAEYKANLSVKLEGQVQGQCSNAKLIGLGVPDEFIDCDTQKGQWAQCKIDREGIYKTILGLL